MYIAIAAKCNLTLVAEDQKPAHIASSIVDAASPDGLV